MPSRRRLRRGRRGRVVGAHLLVDHLESFEHLTGRAERRNALRLEYPLVHHHHLLPGHPFKVRPVLVKHERAHSPSHVVQHSGAEIFLVLLRSPVPCRSTITTTTTFTICHPRRTASGPPEAAMPSNAGTGRLDLSIMQHHARRALRRRRLQHLCFYHRHLPSLHDIPEGLELKAM